MSIAYLNEKFVPLEQAQISVLDRGFLFGDGVYEVIPVYGGRPLRLQQHLQRLEDSLNGIRLQNPHSTEQWQNIITSLIEQNHGGELSLYLQVTRGIYQKRDHAFPDVQSPTVFMMCTALKPPPEQMIKQGAKLVTLPDIRWQYCHLKTIALLANVLLKEKAADQDADEAILIRDGYAKEGTTANFFIVKDGVIYTPPKSADLLPGVTRDLILELAEKNNIPYQEEEIKQERLLNADELWISSSTRELISVTQLDGKNVANGKPGALWSKMAVLYADYKQQLINGEVI